MTDDYTVRIAARDQHALRYAAAREGVTMRAYLETVLARHAEHLPMPPLDQVARPRESQTERRARLRALDPDGMSPYTRELQIITTTKENHGA